MDLFFYSLIADHLYTVSENGYGWKGHEVDFAGKQVHTAQAGQRVFDFWVVFFVLFLDNEV